MTENCNIFQGRLDGRQREHLNRLLDMMYRPSELAAEIGVSKKHFYRVYIPLGCPHQQDGLHNFWINGQTFHEWYLETYKKANYSKGQAHCLTCKVFVYTINNETRQTPEGLVYEVGSCPVCGRTIARIITQRGNHD